VTINSSARTGEVALSGQLGIVEGQLAFVLSSIKDPEDATRPADSERIGFSVTVDGEPVECEVGPTSETQQAPVDVVFINDTTASMSGTVNGIADSISEFASSVAERGIDARFSMITYGDEFSTLSAGETAYVVGQGEFTASELDASSRPYVDLVELDRFKEFLAEVRAPTIWAPAAATVRRTPWGLYATPSRRSPSAPVPRACWSPSGTTPRTPSTPTTRSPPRSRSTSAHPPWTICSPPSTGRRWFTWSLTTRTASPTTTSKGSPTRPAAPSSICPDGVVDLTSTALNNWVGSTYFGVCFDVAPGDRVFEIAATVTGEAVHEGLVTYDVTLE
jgi:hypothetical protein